MKSCTEGRRGVMTQNTLNTLQQEFSRKELSKDDILQTISLGNIILYCAGVYFPLS